MEEMETYKKTEEKKAKNPYSNLEPQKMEAMEKYKKTEEKAKNPYSNLEQVIFYGAINLSSNKFTPSAFSY